MADLLQRLRRIPHLDKIAVVATMGGFLSIALSNTAEPSEDELAALAAPFRFTSVEIPPAGPAPTATFRHLHPDLEHIDGWFGANGASIALADLDGDGLPNDACLVDPRNDTVTLTPVPPNRPGAWPAFALPQPGDGRRADTFVPMGCVFGDFDADGRLDTVAVFVGRPPLLYRALSDTPSPDAIEVVRLPGEGGGLGGTVIADDFDGDGWLDLLVTGYFKDGTNPKDVTGAVPMELQQSFSRAHNGGINRWYHNRTGVTGQLAFQEVSATMDPAINNGWTLGVGSVDLTGDGLPEVYVANDYGQDRMLLNRSQPGSIRFDMVEGRRAFDEPRSWVMGKDTFAGMGAEFADFTGDGRLDLLVPNMAEVWGVGQSHYLWEHTGDDSAWEQGRPPYRNNSESRGVARNGWAWDGKGVDLNNDGQLELIQPTGFMLGEGNTYPRLYELAMSSDALTQYPGNWPAFRHGEGLSENEHDRLYVMDASGRFRDIAPTLGLDAYTAARGAAPGDVDGDGDMDFAMAYQWAAAKLFVNESQAAGPSLVLTLLRRTPNGRTMPAIGAIARTTTPAGRPLIGYVDGGSGHGGGRAHQVHFGLGEGGGNGSVPIQLAWRTAEGPASATVDLRPGHHRIILDDLAAQGPPAGVSDQPLGD